MTTSNSLDDPRLLSEWLAVGWSREIAIGATLARRIMGRDVVLWRSAEGALHCWLDLCVHRGAKLSLGAIQNNGGQQCLACPYHGWKYAESGQCVSIPAHPGLTPPAKARVQTFTVRERYGVIWVCFGEPALDLPDFPIAEEEEIGRAHV